MDKTTDLMAQIDTNFQLTTTDLVAGLVSKWEGKLYALKDELSAQITSINKSISSLETTIVDEMRVKLDEQLKGVYALDNATVSFDKPEFQWDRAYNTIMNNTFCMYVRIKLDLGKNIEHTELRSRFVEPIPQNHVASRAVFIDERTQLNDRLVAVMTEIKSVSRKERELKAVLVDQKMAQLGIDNPFENEQLLKLLDVKI